MTHHVGLDVSVRETSICIVDEAGTIVKEAHVPTEPSIIIEMLTAPGIACRRIGLEAVRFRNGCSMNSPERVFRRSVLRRVT